MGTEVHISNRLHTSASIQSLDSSALEASRYARSDSLVIFLSWSSFLTSLCMISRDIRGTRALAVGYKLCRWCEWEGYGNQSRQTLTTFWMRKQSGNYSWHPPIQLLVVKHFRPLEDDSSLRYFDLRRKCFDFQMDLSKVKLNPKERLSDICSIALQTSATFKQQQKLKISTTPFNWPSHPWSNMEVTSILVHVTRACKMSLVCSTQFVGKPEGGQQCRPEHSALLWLSQYAFLHVKPPWQLPNHFHLLLQIFGMHCQTICLPSQLFLFLEELSNITYSSLLTLTVVQNLVRSNQLNVSHFVIQHQLLPLRRPETSCRPIWKQSIWAPTISGSD